MSTQLFIPELSNIGIRVTRPTVYIILMGIQPDKPDGGKLVFPAEIPRSSARKSLGLSDGYAAVSGIFGVRPDNHRKDSLRPAQVANKKFEDLLLDWIR